VLGTVSAAALFVCTAFIGAQAPANPPQTPAPAAAPGAAPPAGRGTPLPGTESGWATFQGQCYGCHRNESPDGTPTAASIRQLTPERIFESLAGRNHGNVVLSDIQKQRVAEFMSGRPMGSIGAGEAKSMPNQCTTNPPMRDPASGPSWNGWGNDLATRDSSRGGARLAAADVPKLKLKWAFGFPRA
jgi:polyvinyl alcohol dehydrogenase (cytochrome)